MAELEHDASLVDQLDESEDYVETEEHGYLEPRALADIENEQPDLESEILCIGLPPNSRLVLGKKAMFSNALQSANTTVMVNNAKSSVGALDAYDDAARLLQSIIDRSISAEDILKLSVVRSTFLDRIGEISEEAGNQITFRMLSFLEGPKLSGGTSFEEVSSFPASSSEDRLASTSFKGYSETGLVVDNQLGYRNGIYDSQAERAGCQRSKDARAAEARKIKSKGFAESIIDAR